MARYPDQAARPIRDTRSALAVVQRNAQIQAKLIDDLLDMNRLMSGNLQVELVSVDVGGTVQTTIQGLQPAADAKGVDLDCVIDSPVMPACWRTPGGCSRCCGICCTMRSSSHPGAAASRFASAGRTAMSRSSFRTTATGSTVSSCRMSSRDSASRIRRRRVNRRGSASASRSPSIWSSFTAGRSSAFSDGEGSGREVRGRAPGGQVTPPASMPLP